MLCCVCKEKTATVHLTQITGDKMQKVDLCEDCAKSKRGWDCKVGRAIRSKTLKQSSRYRLW